MATHVNDFGTGSVKKRILSQAIPLMMAQAVQLLYNVVDRIYIGHLKDIGDIAMTGLGITFPVIHNQKTTTHSHSGVRSSVQ